MAFSTVQVQSPAKFDAALAEQKGKKNVFALFYGGWCPDCTKADPIIRDALKKLPGATLIVADVGDRATYKNPQFAYRQHSKVKLERIPTLIRVTKGELGDRLVEGELHDIAKVDGFVLQSKL